MKVIMKAFKILLFFSLMGILGYVLCGSRVFAGQITWDKQDNKENNSAPSYMKYRSHNPTYEEYQEEQKKQLWDNSGLKRPKKENQYLQIPHDAFICTTQEDMNHVLDMMIAKKGHYTLQYIDSYSRLVSGTSCVAYNYPYTVLAYVTGIGTYKNIKEVKVMWKQEGLPFREVYEGWICQQLDKSIIDYNSLKTQKIDHGILI